LLPPGGDEYSRRNEQAPWPGREWRHLRADEVERLIQNDNSSEDWDQVCVTDPFDPRKIRNTAFYGLVRIGRIENVILEHHDLRVAAGITDSVVIACDIGDNVAVHHVRYLAHCIVGDRCILLNIDEMHTTNHAKFGNGST
jgi:hypothetical protein